MHALDMALLAATQDVSFGNAETVNFWPLSAAVSDVRKALAAFQRHERPPAPEFFTAQEVARLTYSEGRFQAMDTLTTKLMERHAG
jgi:hypothetical protein